MFKLIFITIITTIFITLTHSNTLSDYETALCIAQPTTCPGIKQRKGVCCKRQSIDSSFRYFNNSCLACKSGCEEYLFKRDDGENCDTINNLSNDL